MRIIFKKQRAYENGDTWVEGPKPNGDLIEEIKSPLFPKWNEFSFQNTKSEHTTQKHIQSTLTEQNYLSLNSNLTQYTKSMQRHWKLLRKLNGRFRKKVCKQQQIKADISRIQKQIIEVKQEIINLHK
jgi:hypothetical protein